MREIAAAALPNPPPLDILREAAELLVPVRALTAAPLENEPRLAPAPDERVAAVDAAREAAAFAAAAACVVELRADELLVVLLEVDFEAEP